MTTVIDSLKGNNYEILLEHFDSVLLCLIKPLFPSFNLHTNTHSRTHTHLLKTNKLPNKFDTSCQLLRQHHRDVSCSVPQHSIDFESFPLLIHACGGRGAVGVDSPGK